ncbi:MAG: PAS domain S-box protein [Bacteroidota bacterium]
MRKEDKSVNDILRKRAEKALSAQLSKSEEKYSETNVRKLIHELEVHQIELEMQNLELTQAQNKATELSEKLTELYDFAPSGYFTLSKDGKIRELNLGGAHMLGKERSRLINSLFSFFVTDDKKKVFNSFLDRVFNNNGTESCEITFALNGEFPMCVYLSGVATKEAEHCHITAVDITASKKSEKALKESEAKLRSSFDQSPVGSVIVDFNKCFTRCNETFCKFIGYTEDELIGKGIADITHPDDVELGIAEMKQILDGEIPSSTVQKRYIRKDGSIVWGEARISVVRDSNNRPLYFLPVIFDITARKMAEEATALANSRIRQLIDSNIIGVIIADANGKILEANNYYLEMLGYTAADFNEGKVDWRKITPPEWLPADERAISELRKAGICIPYEKEYFHVNGSRVSVLLTDALLPGPGEQIVAFAQNITERKEAEAALRNSESLYHLITDKISDVVWLMDLNGKSLFVSPSIVQFTGFSVEEYLNQSFIERFSHESAIYALENFRKEVHLYTSAKTQPPDYKKIMVLEYRCKDGSLKTGEVLITPYFDDNNRCIGLHGVTRDITQRKIVEEKLNLVEKNYRTIFENVQDVFYRTDLSGIIFEISPSIKYFSDFLPEELIGFPVENIYYNPADRNIFIKAISEKGELRDYELRLKTKSGDIRYASINARLIFDENGKPHHIDGALRDITKRKLAEQSLEQIHNQLFKISEQVPGVIYQYRLFADGKSCFPYSSSGMNDIYEYAPDEVREDATPVFGRIHPDDLQNVSDLIFESARTLNHFNCEFRVVLPRQGLRWRYSDAMPERMPDNSTLWHGIIYDITDRKLAELALQKKSDELEHLNSHFVGREIKMIELKKEINELLKQAGQKEKYVIH